MDNLLGLIVGDGRNFILEINKTNIINKKSSTFVEDFSWATRIRTRNKRTKISCVTITPRGNISSLS